MSACPTCGGAMKPLFTGSFCPRDCDKPKAESKPAQGWGYDHKGLWVPDPEPLYSWGSMHIAFTAAGLGTGPGSSGRGWPSLAETTLVEPDPRALPGPWPGTYKRPSNAPWVPVDPIDLPF